MIFKHTIRAVRLKPDRIVVVLEHKIFIYNITTLQIIIEIETSSNPNGLCSMNTDSERTIIACPGRKIG